MISKETGPVAPSFVPLFSLYSLDGKLAFFLSHTTPPVENQTKGKIDVYSGDVLSSSSTFSLFLFVVFSPAFSSLISYDFYVYSNRKRERELSFVSKKSFLPFRDTQK